MPVEAPVEVPVEETRRVVLSEYTQGPEARPTGDKFVAVVEDTRDGGCLTSYLVPSSFGYNDIGAERDEIVVANILKVIAKQNGVGIEVALSLLVSAGEKGIDLKLSQESWDEITTVNYNDEYLRSGETLIPPLKPNLG